MILLSDSEEKPEKERKYLELMLRQCVDALVVATVDAKNIELQKIYETGTPVIFIDTVPDTKLQFDAVLVDDYLAGEKIAKHLLELGHTQIAVITGKDPNSTPSVERLRGAADTCEKNGFPIPEELIFSIPYSERSGYETMQRMIRMREKHSFSAVIVMHELMTIGAIKAIRDAGMEIGKDISLAGSDLNERIQLANPQITSIGQPSEEIGELAGRLILQRLEEKKHSGAAKMLENAGQKILLNPILDIRESCLDMRK